MAGYGLVGCGSDPANTRVEALYRQGNQLFERGLFAEASRTYNRIVELGVRNGHVYYNLGNAYYRQDEIARAILAYERAYRLMPRDQDLRTNLEIANSLTVDQITGEVEWVGIQALGRMTINEVLITVTVIGMFFALVLILKILSRDPAMRARLGYVLLAAGLIFILSMTLAGIKIYGAFAHTEGIVLSSQAVIRTSPVDGSDSTFTLHEGAKVRLIENRDQWIRIRLPDGKNGWVHRDEIEAI